MLLDRATKTLLVSMFVLTGGSAAQNGGMQSTLDGIFTEAQARRGAIVNEAVCVECHQNEEFTGAFLDSWTGAPVSMLLEEITALMPEDMPGSLKPQEYADVLAYIFQLNGIPAGQRELASDPSLLVSILIERPPQP
jgi:mono/diheme cytochrome c family protein